MSKTASLLTSISLYYIICIILADRLYFFYFNQQCSMSFIINNVHDKNIKYLLVYHFLIFIDR